MEVGKFFKEKWWGSRRGKEGKVKEEEGDKREWVNKKSENYTFFKGRETRKRGKRKGRI